MNDQAIISDRHRALYAEHYGHRVVTPRPSRWQPMVEALAARFHAESVLDYGAGPDAALARFSKLPIVSYDPCVEALAAAPQPADVVVCFHALEHVEVDCVDAVLAHLESLARRALLLVVSTKPSTKLLPDGSPWHSFVRDRTWWTEKLAGFDQLPPLEGRQEVVALKIVGAKE